MNEVERMNRGLVLRAERLHGPSTRRVVAVTHKTAKGALADVHRRQRRGEVESAGALQLIPSGPLAGQYAVRVVLISTPRPARSLKWMYPVAALLGGVGLVVGAVAWFLAALSAASLVGLCVTLLLALAIVVGAGRGGRGGNVSVISNIRVDR